MSYFCYETFHMRLSRSIDLVFVVFYILSLISAYMYIHLSKCSKTVKPPENFTCEKCAALSQWVLLLQFLF